MNICVGVRLAVGTVLRRSPIDCLWFRRPDRFELAARHRERASSARLAQGLCQDEYLAPTVRLGLLHSRSCLRRFDKIDRTAPSVAGRADAVLVNSDSPPAAQDRSRAIPVGRA